MKKLGIFAVLLSVALFVGCLKPKPAATDKPAEGEAPAAAPADAPADADAAKPADADALPGVETEE